MVNKGWAGKKRPDNGPPLREQIRLPEADGMIFERLPANQQQVAVFGFNAPVQIQVNKPVGLADNGFSFGELLLKLGLPTRLNGNERVFNNHTI